MISTKNVTEDKFLLYALTQSGTGESLKDHVGETFDVDAFALFERPDAETGEMKPSFNLITPEGEIFGTGSPAFCDTLANKILTVFDPEEIKRLRVVEKTSKQGRTYIQPVPVR